MKLSSHPTVQAYHQTGDRKKMKTGKLAAADIKEMAAQAGMQDAGIVDLARQTLSDYRRDLTQVMHDTKSILMVVARVNRTALQSGAHSVADQEFKRTWDAFKHKQGVLVDRLNTEGIKAVAMPIGFPMEMKRWPEQIWLTNEKLFSMEAGLGRMGLNRLLLHPEYGGSILLGTILLAHECDQYDSPIDFNPCIQCGLCVKICPTGAVKTNDDFNFISCYSHNYRERLGGFLNWVEQIVESKDTADYRRRVHDSETFSMWQNLAIGSQTRCDRCMAVCPAGTTAIGEYLEDRKSYIQNYLNTFRQMPETVYAVKGSDADYHIQKHFSDKTIKYISNGIRPVTTGMFLSSLPRIFQRTPAKGLDAVYHFSFTGNETLSATVIIKDQTIRVQEGLKGEPDLQVSADSRTWIRFLAGEVHLLMALLTRKIKIKGAPSKMKAFARCFPS